MITFTRWITASLLTALIVFVSPSNAHSDEQAQRHWPHEQSDISADPDVLFGALDNGMRYAILANDTPKNTASLRMSFSSGSLEEEDDERGLFHFLEHMAFNGSTDVPEGEMVKILERLGLAFGPDTNASTNFDEVQYQLDLPDTRDELIDTGLFLFRQTASELTLAQDAIDRERGVILSEKRARNSVGLRLYEAFNAFLAPDARVTQRLPIGTDDVIEMANREKLVDIYQSYYRPDAATLVVVGDIDPSDIENRIKAQFEDWAVTTPAPIPAPPGKFDFERSSSAGSFTDPDATPLVTLIYPMPFEKTHDTASARSERLKRRIAFGIINRRFDRKAREEGAVYLNASISTSSFENLVDTISLSAVTTQEDWPKAIEALEQEYRRARVYGFTEAEIQEQLASIEASLEASAERADTRRTASLANNLISSFQNETVFSTPQSGLERYLARKETITPASVRATLDRFFETSPPQIFVSLPQPEPNLETTALDALKRSMAENVLNESQTETTAFAYTNFGPAGQIIADDVQEDFDIRRVQFENGVRLNLKRTDFQDKAILLSLRVGEGNLALPLEPDGLTTFLGSSFSQGGLEAHSIDDLRSLLAGRLVGLSLSSGSDALGAQSSTEAEDLLLQLQLWTAYLSSPGYRPEGERLWRRQIETVFDQLDGTPQAILSYEVSRFLRNGHAHFGLADKESLLSLNYSDLRPSLDPLLKEGAIELGVVGDFDEDAVIAAVSQTLGALPPRRKKARELAEARDAVDFTSERGTRTFYHSGVDPKALVRVTWALPDGSDDALEANVDLMMEVLKLKLTQTLREDQGATYGASTLFNMSEVYPGFGYAAATIDVDPADIASVTQTILDQATAMANGSVSQDELDRARRPITERFDESLESNRFWLGFVAQAQSKPEQLDWIDLRESYYSDVTPEAISALAAEYLTPKQALIIEILPTILADTK